MNQRGGDDANPRRLRVTHDSSEQDRGKRNHQSLTEEKKRPKRKELSPDFVPSFLFTSISK